MTSNLDGIYHKIKDETYAIILPNSFPDKYKDLKYGIIYGNGTLTFYIVVRSKDLEIKVSN